MMRLSNHSALVDLLAGLTVYDGTVPALPVFPYVLVRTFTPDVTARSLNRTVHARVDRWRLTVAGLNQASVMIVANTVTARLEGARLNGQRLEAIPDWLPILEDEDVKLDNNRHPLYTVLEWRVMH